jgi:hypothetical protein
MSKKQESTAVATQVNGVQEQMPDWLKKGNAGSEDVGASDMILPRVDVLQALSPQIKKSDPNYIDGAEQGQIFNTVTGEIYGSSVQFIPVLFRKEYTVWKLRKAGGGFCGAYKSKEEGEAAVAAMQNPVDYECVESHQHFCMLLTDHGPEEAVFSMTKSKLKVSRALNTLVQIAGVDRFAKAYRMDAIETSSDKGEFWSFKVHPSGFVSKELYDRGQGLYEMIRAGAADVDRADAGDAAPAYTGSAEL